MKRLGLNTIFAIAFSTVGLGATSLAAEKFTVELKGKITTLNELAKQAESVFQLGAEISYKIEFDTDDSIVKENERMVDYASVRRIEAVVGGYRFMGEAAELTIDSGGAYGQALYLFGQDPESYKIHRIEPKRDFTKTDGVINDMPLLKAGVSVESPNFEFVHKGDSLSDVMKRLSETFEKTDGIEFSIRFADPKNRYDLFENVEVLGLMTSVSFTVDPNQQPSLKARVLSDEEVAKLGEVLLECIAPKGLKAPLTPFDLTREEAFVKKRVSPSLIDRLEDRAKAAGATYRLMSIPYRFKAITGNPNVFAYVSVLKRGDGKVMVTLEHYTGGSGFGTRKAGGPCHRGKWANELDVLWAEY